MSENLMDGLLSELNRNRELLKEYEAIPAGFIGATFIKMSIWNGERAIASGDVIAMLQSYEELKDNQ